MRPWSRRHLGQHSRKVRAQRLRQGPGRRRRLTQLMGTRSRRSHGAAWATTSTACVWNTSRVLEVRGSSMNMLQIAAPALLVSTTLLGCGGQLAIDQEDPDDAGAVPRSCIAAQCAAQVGRSDAGYLCGTPPGTSPGFVIWLARFRGSDAADDWSPDESCICLRNDAGQLTSCEVVTREYCEAQPNCEACNANSACAWCRGSPDVAPHCAFRPAEECVRRWDSLSTPDCSQ